MVPATGLEGLRRSAITAAFKRAIPTSAFWVPLANQIAGSYSARSPDGVPIAKRGSQDPPFQSSFNRTENSNFECYATAISIRLDRNVQFREVYFTEVDLMFIWSELRRLLLAVLLIYGGTISAIGQGTVNFSN